MATINAVGYSDDEHVEAAVKSVDLCVDTSETNASRFNANYGGTSAGIDLEVSYCSTDCSCKTILKLTTAKSLFNAIDTMMTVWVVADVGVDVSSSTNMSAGTCTDTCIGELTSLNCMGGALGLVTPLTVSSHARCAC